MNMPSKFTPDPRTFVVLQKLMDSQPPGVSDDAVIEAFYSYFDTTLKNCSVGNISKQWLENMKKSVPLNLQYAHPQMMEDLLFGQSFDTLCGGVFLAGAGWMLVERLIARDVRELKPGDLIQQL